MGYAIVVDASVARAAGESGKPEPEACRLALLAIKNNNHRLAMSQQIRDEWMRARSGRLVPYASLFALQWLTDMQRAGRVQMVKLARSSQLRRRCLNALAHNPHTQNLVSAIAKDFHLIETALKTDQRVLSLDQKIVGHLAHLKNTTGAICAVMWVHPVIHRASNWLDHGAPDTPAYHVC